MFSYMQKQARRTFDPPPTPVPRRSLSDRAVNPQDQSSFFKVIPAEVRNWIYVLVFSTAASHLHRQSRRSRRNTTRPEPTHPLDLLLTCGKINLEATVLAFETYTFVLCRPVTFYSLQTRTLRLSRAQFHALTTLAYDSGARDVYQSGSRGEFLANTLLLFPSVRRLEIRVQRRPLRPDLAHTLRDVGPAETFEDELLRKYVPLWFYAALMDVVRSRCYRWQKGEGWRIVWPLLTGLDTGCGGQARRDQQWEVNRRSDLALGEGVELCGCGCGELAWLKAELVQEGGRKVGVEIVESAEMQKSGCEELKLGVRLKELGDGVEALPVVHGTRSVRWDADEAYWENFRGGNKS